MFFLTVLKKKVFIHFAKKGKKDRKAFPSLVSVHCQHMKYSMWFLLCERNKNEKRELGRLMLWSFMHKHIGEKNTHFLHPDHQSCQLGDCWQLLFPTKLFNKSGDANLFFLKRFLMSWWSSGEERKKKTGDGSIPTTGWLNWGRSSKSTGYSGWGD